MLIRTIVLKDFLSFGDYEQWVDLHPLNVIVGKNGGGKSNFIKALEFISQIPHDLDGHIRNSGGVEEWLYNCDEDLDDIPTATVQAAFKRPETEVDKVLRYKMSFTSDNGSFRLVDELVENSLPRFGKTEKPSFYYRYNNGNPVVGTNKSKIPVNVEDLNHSVIAQNALGHYRQIESLTADMAGIRVYKDWVFGRGMLARRPQSAGFGDKILKPDFSNLPTVLSAIEKDPEASKLFLSLLSANCGIEDIEVETEGLHMTAYVAQNGLESLVPVSRLSDGDLRYLCLLAILMNPSLPPLACIDGVDLGIHPDMLPGIADILRQASKKCQIIVASHSEKFLDAFDIATESVLLCEKDIDGSTLERLKEAK
jgi:predicted ATPase